MPHNDMDRLFSLLAKVIERLDKVLNGRKWTWYKLKLIVITMVVTIIITLQFVQILLTTK